MPRTLAALLLALLVCVPAAIQAQDRGDAQGRLDKVKRELAGVAAERRRIEGQRGDATRKLRDMDERVGASNRELQQANAQLKRQQAELADMQVRRNALDKTLTAQRSKLAALLRAAYTVGDDAPLKLMLAQDRVADSSRLLAYHGYLQRDRARRIAALRAQLAGLAELERGIARTNAALVDTRARRQAELAQLDTDRAARTRTLAKLEHSYQDRRSREQVLGRDAQGLENVLAQLRAAAKRAERERRDAARQASPGAAPKAGGSRRPPPPQIANAQPMKVGGLGWPLSGSLVASFGGTLPDGRRSQGVLIAAPSGTPVHAVANGKVVFAEWMGGYGLICIIDHGDGYMSLYANNDGLLRDAGSSVKRGDTIASVGNSGGQGRTALYFELRRNGQPVDPRSWLQKR